MTEPLCPFNDGRHKRVNTRFGMVCMSCHKTWQWAGKELVATWTLHGWDAPNPLLGGR